MKADLIDVNETRKNLKVEIPSDVVDAQIARVALDYSRKARIPGFRPGKAPARVIKQRFKEQILHDVAHDLVPHAIDEAMRERGIEPVDTPDVHDVTVEEGRALTFTASFETVPAFEPGEYSTMSLRRPRVAIDEEAVDGALQRLRDRAARHEPVEGRGVIEGDTVTLDLERTQLEPAAERGEGVPAEPLRGRDPGVIKERGEGVSARQDRGAGAPGVIKDKHTDVAVALGAKANPPGFDEQLMGLEVGATKTFTIQYPADYAIAELANATVEYRATVKGIKRRVLPELDDEFAKDLGEFDTLAALRARVREDLEHEARHAADREVRAELMKALAGRVPFEVPASLIDREVDRRIEEFARRLMDQNIDPRQAGIDWNAFRESQREVAREAVAGAIVLDEVARREQLDVTQEEMEREIARYAERTGRAPAAVRAALEKEGGLSRVYSSLRREKAIDFVMARATIAEE
jgi:trigger factor